MRRCDCGCARWRSAWAGGWFCDNCRAPNPDNPGYPAGRWVRQRASDLWWAILRTLGNG